MKWAFSIKHKAKAALLLAVVLVLVLGKNLLDSNQVQRLGSSFSMVYEDRLLVESYIYRLSGHLYEKKLLVDHSYLTGNQTQLPGPLKANNQAIAALLQDYEKTQLTQAEDRFLRAFQKNLLALQQLENGYLTSSAEGQAALLLKKRIDARHAAAARHLNQLSEIQVQEGKRLNEESKKIIAGSAILTQFELVLVVGLGVMIQMLMFASKSQISKFPQKPMLN